MTQLAAPDRRSPAPEAETRGASWSPPRVATAVALGAWAGLFWFLLISGRTWLYLSSRTAWLVPVGAAILTVATVGRLVSARSERPESLSKRTAWGLGFILLPVVTVLALPPTALGSFAASRRSVKAGFSTGSVDVRSGPITFASIAAAGWSEDARRALVNRAGTPVTFDGIVTRRDGQPADEFILTRFIITCCVADALSVQIRVVGAPPGKFRSDQWVRVKGTFYPLEREMVVAASSIEPIPRPEKPYVNV